MVTLLNWTQLNTAWHEWVINLDWSEDIFFIWFNYKFTIEVKMKIPFLLSLFLIVNLRVIRITHKLNQVYSYAGNTHYANQKPQHQDQA